MNSEMQPEARVRIYVLPEAGVSMGEENNRVAVTVVWGHSVVLARSSGRIGTGPSLRAQLVFSRVGQKRCHQSNGFPFLFSLV